MQKNFYVCTNSKTTMANGKIIITGAGLVGSLLSIYLAKRGYDVHIYEKRADYRKSGAFGGRSINLAMSSRGLNALQKVGLDEKILGIATPMYGRMIHDKDGNEFFQAYGKDKQAIHSVSRGVLNTELIRAAADCSNVKFNFEHTAKTVDLEHKSITFFRADGSEMKDEADLIIGSDGAFSAVRLAMQMNLPLFNYSQQYVAHGYKELLMPADASGGYRMNSNALHIWPRKSFMLIALPNQDGSFTCTLFLPFEGDINAFESLNNREKVRAFFQKNFPDVVQHFPDLEADFEKNPVSGLVTVRCQPWIYKRSAMLIGDAAHAIVPFYGQGMNAGFEDCSVLNELLDVHHDNWQNVLPDYEIARKTNGDAIADLALKNFVEMRDKVADKKFLLRKKIEAFLFDKFPDLWTPQYTLVTFSNTPYREAWNEGLRQDEVMEKIMALPNIEENWQNIDYLAFLEG